jgi:hypothetical protein
MDLAGCKKDEEIEGRVNMVWKKKSGKEKEER